MDDLNFDGLSESQCWIILRQGWQIGDKNPDGSPAVQPTIDEVKILIDRGLMTSRIREMGLMRVVEYCVPIHVHMAFCEWCADQPSDD